MFVKRSEMDYFCEVPIDIKNIIVFNMDIHIINAFMRVCKSWLIIIQSGFDYKYHYNLPLVWNYIHQNYTEFKRLLKYNLNLYASSDLLRIAIVYNDFRIVKRILREPNLDLTMNGVHDTHYHSFNHLSIEYPSNKRIKDYCFMTDSLIYICCMSARLDMLKLLLAYDPELVFKVMDLRFALLYDSCELYQILFKYIGEIQSTHNILCLFILRDRLCHLTQNHVCAPMLRAYLIKCQMI